MRTQSTTSAEERWAVDQVEHLLSQEVTATFLEKMHSVTAPGGRIAIMGPSVRYGSKECFDMADHTLVDTHNPIAEHLDAAGYEPDVIHPQFVPSSFTGRLPPSLPLPAATPRPRSRGVCSASSSSSSAVASGPVGSWRSADRRGDLARRRPGRAMSACPERPD